MSWEIMAFLGVAGLGVAWRGDYTGIVGSHSDSSVLVLGADPFVCVGGGGVVVESNSPACLPAPPDGFLGLWVFQEGEKGDIIRFIIHQIHNK